MDGKRGPGRRSDIPWDKVQADYEAGLTVKALAEKYGISEKQIRRKIKSQKWETKSAKVQAAQNKVIDIATRQAIENVTPELQKQIESGLLRHAEIEELLLEVAVATLRRVRQQMVARANRPLRSGRNTSEADEIRAAMESAIKALTGSRELHGLRPGDPSVGEGTDRDDAIRIVREVVRPPQSA
jgi:hypothetical protein